MNNQLVSVIVATFNSEKTLNGALTSVCNQTYQNWECIIVDGVSKDSTLEIIEMFEKKDTRFRHISEPDKGIYDALNKGVALAKGEWVYVLGSDDEILKDGLSSFVPYFENYDFIYGNYISLFSTGETYNGIAYPLSKLPLVMPTSHQSMIMRKSLITKCGGFNLQYPSRADHNLVVAACVRGYRIHRIDSYICRMRKDGFSNDRSDYIKQYYSILKNNRACRHPYLVACYYGLRWYVGRKILDPLRKNGIKIHEKKLDKRFND